MNLSCHGLGSISTLLTGIGWEAHLRTELGAFHLKAESLAKKPQSQRDGSSRKSSQVSALVWLRCGFLSSGRSPCRDTHWEKGSWSTGETGGSQGEGEAGQVTPSFKAHGTCSVIVAAVLPPAQFSKPPPGNLEPSRGRSAAAGGFRGVAPSANSFPNPRRRALRSPAQPSRPDDPPAPRGSAGDCFCLALAEAAFGSRAPRAASSQPIGRYSRVPSVPRPPRAGPVRAAPGVPPPALPPPLTPHEFHASRCSSAPAPSPPPSPPERVLSSPFSPSLSSRRRSRAPRSGTVASDFPPGPAPPRVPLRQPQRAPPALAASPRPRGRTPGLRPVPRPLRGAGGPARGRLPRPPAHLALARSRAAPGGRAPGRAVPGGRAPGRALRAPASPGSCQCGDCAGKHGDRGDDPH